ncbi:hypothetical protein D3C80_1360610 [compost metagenome]
MTAGLGADRRKGFHAGAVFFHVFAASAAEEHQGARHADAFREYLGGTVEALAHGQRTISPEILQRTRLHLLEAKGQGAIDSAAFHRLARHEQRGRAAGAVVVDVDHRNAGHADFIQRRLAAGGVAIDITGIGLLHQLITDTGILQRLAHSLGAHLDVAGAGTGLGELDHADTGNIGFLGHLLLRGQLT